jgi:hypothetical protein
MISTRGAENLIRNFLHTAARLQPETTGSAAGLQVVVAILQRNGSRVLEYHESELLRNLGSLVS